MFRLRIFIQILVLIVIQASCNSQDAKEQKIRKEKILSIEKDFINKGILKDNTAMSYMNMYIKSYSYNYTIKQRLIIWDLLKLHLGDELKITDDNNDTIAMYRYNSNWDSINKHMRKIYEVAYFGGTNDKKEEAYINEYIKNPDEFLRKRLKVTFFENDEAKFLSYISLYLLFENYKGGDIGFEYWVKRYQVYGDALLDPNFKEDDEIEEVEEDESDDEENKIIIILEEEDSINIDEENIDSDVPEIEIIEIDEEESPEN